MIKIPGPHLIFPNIYMLRIFYPHILRLILPHSSFLPSFFLSPSRLTHFITSLILSTSTLSSTCNTTHYTIYLMCIYMLNPGNSGVVLRKDETLIILLYYRKVFTWRYIFHFTYCETDRTVTSSDSPLHNTK